MVLVEGKVGYVCDEIKRGRERDAMESSNVRGTGGVVGSQEGEDSIVVRTGLRARLEADREGERDILDECCKNYNLRRHHGDRTGEVRGRG